VGQFIFSGSAFTLSDWIKFMGTAGARFVVAKQLRSSAATWCNLQGLQILIDPGPGTLSRCFASRPKLDPEKLDAVLLTHRHLDHSTDVNVIIEAMTQGTFNKRGALFIPSDAVHGAEPVVFSHVRRSVERLKLLREGGSYRLGPISFSTPVRHRHPVETYGLVFHLPGCRRIAFIIDTNYFPELEEHYARCEVLIMNVMLFQSLHVKEIQHLDLQDAKTLVSAIKPRLAVMTHFGMTMLHHKPHLLAGRLSAETGVKVIAATDGMTLKLDDLPSK
jgi:phosphoribosyl 1,2-cyclic phosphodiesterase